MSFREKSAWGMGVLMLVTGLWYAWMAVRIPLDAPAMAQLGAIIPYVFVVVIGSIVVQVTLAIRTPREAEASADERERAVIDKAGHWSGYVLGFGVVCGALAYVQNGLGNGLFLWVTGALIVAQIAEYALQVYFFRRGV